MSRADRVIRIVPWTENFLAAVSDHLAARHGEGFADLTVIFPHRRAGRYLIDRLLAEPRLPKPLLAPEIVPVEEWLADLGARLAPRPPKMLNALDRTGLLFEIVRELRQTAGGRARDFPEDLSRFFPWGMRLAALCEELFRQNVPARDLLYVEDQVAPPAAAILENLRAIRQAYRERLEAEGLGTPGLCQAYAAENAERAATLLSGRRLVSCGAYVMSGAEKAVCRQLFDAGLLEFLWHADPALAEDPGRAHFACREQADWLKEWGVRAELLGAPPHAARPKRRSARNASPARPILPGLSLPDAAQGAAKGLRPGATQERTGEGPRFLDDVRFYEAYDLHSQLAALAGEMAEAESLADCAVVLPDPGMLMPVLRHLPRQDVNISMGYPLSRSSLSLLLETLMRLQENRFGERGYSWRDVTALLRHPYLRMLRLGEAEPLRRVFHDFEEQIRSGGKYLDPAALDVADHGEAPHEEVAALIARVFAVCLDGFATAESFEALGRALTDLAGLLLDEAHCGDVWERHLIDAECLFRLGEGIIPVLSSTRIGRERLPRAALFAALRGLLAKERTAFEAEPLTGLQVLGLLETRLMTFDTVFLVNAIEEDMPGAPPQDPLLPDALRRPLGLPDARRRDLVAAYNFYRLLMGARRAVIFHQTGVSGGAAFEDKAVRSRFVEQLLWELEKRRGALIKPGDEPLRTVAMPLRPLPPRDDAAPKTPSTLARLSARLTEKPLSASFFDAYLRCPLQFYYRYLTPLKPLEEVAEDGDPLAFGELVHAVLREFLTPYVGREIEEGELPAEELRQRYLDKLEAAPLYHQASPDLRLTLERAGCERLRRFAENAPRTTPLALETELRESLVLAGRSCLVRGTIDRADRRDGEILILDYKTGSLKRPAQDIWEDVLLFGRLATWEPAEGDALFLELSRRLLSVQLPLYMRLYAAATGTMPANAAFVELRDSSRELPLFESKIPPEVRERAIAEETPKILTFLIRHMLETPRFEPLPSSGCQWCDYRELCKGTA